MPYPGAAAECGACGRVRDPLITPPPIVEAARPETYRQAAPPSVLRVTPNDGLTIAVAILVALAITAIRLYFGVL